MGCCGSSGREKANNTVRTDKNLSPLDLLKIRLAKGEVSFEEYEKTKAVLSE